MYKVNAFADRLLSRLVAGTTARAGESCEYAGWWQYDRDGMECWKRWIQQRTDCTLIKYPYRRC
ncbi:hypothetical protein LX16_2058 [Stackebrandtia albiflava]|uniref:Uncharacterized protein n=1 Tax=Stackebrandtia albiflava TaxID=406432 RepID=A0A562VEL5_9ACTN|nr:hypothetical protein [Stackebrandtia albiflava]TWJ16329.1 hypothetical protein LX16_2058 [Stackebrandtia albiflava]